MKNKKDGFILISIFVAFSLLSFAAPVYAQNGPHRMDFPPGPPEGAGIDDCGHGPFFDDYDELKDKLKLTDEQADRISALKLKQCKKMLEHEEKIAPLKVRLKRLLLADNIDLKAVKELLKAIAEIEVEIRFGMIEHRVEIERILTHKQLDKLRLLFKPRRGKPGPPPPRRGRNFEEKNKSGHDMDLFNM